MVRLSEIAYAAPSFGKSTVAAYRNVFDSADLNHDGHIDLKELN